MTKNDESWGRFAVKAAVLGVVVMVAAIVGVRIANARDGVAGGTARTFLTVAGKITGMTGTQRATFHFQRRGVRTDLCAPQADIVIGAEGAFSVEVPLDDMTSRCPTTMFDGSDVVVTVDLPGRAAVVNEASINPVPYAMYAGAAAGAVGTLDTRLIALERRAQALEATVNVTNRARGVGRMSDEDIRVPQTSLVTGTPRSSRAMIVTASVTAPNVVHTGSWLVITGDQTGAFVSRLALSSYTSTGTIDLVATIAHTAFTTDEALRGVTLRVRGVLPPWDWKYSVVPVDLPP